MTIIDGHPDPDGSRFIHALADAYAEGAGVDNEVRCIRVADLDFPLIHSRQAWEHGKAPGDIVQAQEAIAWAEHLVILYPLWLGDVPALLKGFFEQVMRPDFAFRYVDHGLPQKLLKGRSARLIVTMGMPALAYRLFYRAHSLKSLKRNILNFTGLSPVRSTIIGGIEGSPHRRKDWLARVCRLGTKAR
ncbi:NAD(P)H-dependent oxidoreductase [Sphingosinicella rhizophila]|uniref:NAD(P)H-dependent oxidoreductase n=1 Tax=Sphingosinicella rhizophila TaxID=3050082 RepID=A0ABU3Q6H3_9SPHN|nr:NAD(P)H-dependent oxidoreductase [Sphingosinicella sp. GR2756]MDT9599018.1 NAD(P)H-dependent oxidoreductase [Sphingosinicella sp. GR2756]